MNKVIAIFANLHRRVGLETKIVTATVLAIVLITIGGSGYFYIKTKAMIFDDLRKRGITICENVSHDAKLGVLTEDVEILNELVHGVMQTEDVVYAVIQDENGKTLMEKTIVEVPEIASLKKKALITKDSEISLTKDNSGNLIYNFTSPIIIKRVSLAEIGGVEPELEKEPAPEIRGTVQVGLSLENILSRLKGVLRVIIVLTLLIIGIGVILSLGFAKLIIKPIGEMTKAAVRIASGDLTQAVEVKSQDEIGQFAHQFNVMTDALRKHTFELTVANEQLTKEVIDRKRAESALENLNKELKATIEKLTLSKRELEDFAHVAAHDLKAPLVNIQGFSQELSHSCELLRSVLQDKKIDEKSRSVLSENIPEAVSFILTSASKMDLLLSGLLRLSQLGRTLIKIELLDMNAMIDNVIGTMEYQIKETGVTVEVEQLPNCFGDASQINQVFSNLLDNAIKYLDSSRPGEIHIYGTIEHGQSIYCVEDNGIGIDAEYKDKIFEIFDRLKPDQTTGEGLGLTIVRRILDRHNGSVWLESELDKGSRFFVSLQSA